MDMKTRPKRNSADYHSCGCIGFKWDKVISEKCAVKSEKINRVLPK